MLSKGVMLGIPLDADPSIRILSIETVDLQGQIHLCPAATPMLRRDLAGSPKYLEDSLAENPQAYSQDAFLPSQPFEIITGGMIRSQRLARLYFKPFQYNPSRDHFVKSGISALRFSLGAMRFFTIPQIWSMKVL